MMWRLYVGIAFTVIVLAFGFHYRLVMKENTKLKTQINKANNYIVALDNTAVKMAEIHKEERALVDEIDNTPDSDDGVVAPVLRRTINSMQ